MVVKQRSARSPVVIEFESRVILDGSQTNDQSGWNQTTFESRVILDGSQTYYEGAITTTMFESRVILDGSQTHCPCF